MSKKKQPLFVKIFQLGAVACFLTINPVFAKADCLSEVRQVYRDHLNGYKRLPYRSTRIIFDKSGKKKGGFDFVVQTPLRILTKLHGGGATLAIDDKSWGGPDITGPWKPTKNYYPKDRKGQHDNIMRQNIKNMKDVKCYGVVEIDGKKWLHYQFSTRTDPAKVQNGMWFGSTDDIYLDPQSKFVMRWDRRNFITSFRPKPNGDRSEQTFVYDKNIKVDPPR